MTDSLHALTWVKALLSGGLAAYATLLAINNLTDQATNANAIVRMMTMRELKADAEMGRGVVWRAVDSAAVHRFAFYSVIVSQVVIAFLLWRASSLFVIASAGGYDGHRLSSAVAAANLGLLTFMGLWLAMIVVGIWFSYWVKMGPIQQTHMTLLGISLLSILIINS